MIRWHVRIHNVAQSSGPSSSRTFSSFQKAIPALAEPQAQSLPPPPLATAVGRPPLCSCLVRMFRTIQDHAGRGPLGLAFLTSPHVFSFICAATCIVSYMGIKHKRKVTDSRHLAGYLLSAGFTWRSLRARAATASL